MEVDDGSKSEVVTVEEGKQSRGWKQVPSSPPKQSRKRACITTATQMTMGSQAKTESAGGMGIRCERCIQQGIVCMVVDRGAQCANCKAKHYGCLLVVAKEVMRGKGSLVGSQQVRAVTGSQTRGKAMRGKGVKGAALSGLTLGKWVLVPPIRVLTYPSDPGQHEIVKCIKSPSAMGDLFHMREGLCCGIDALHCCLKSYNTELWSIKWEQATCEELVKELEEALEAEVSTDKEEELALERARDEAKR